ncbi:MAG: BrnA antitoxin family protein [Treponema sp.]|nr:BrnA antitoxin family protein [Treponema sp.]
MATKKFILTDDSQLSEESLLRLAALEKLKDSDIDRSDIPEYSDKEWEQMRLWAIEKREKQRKKQMFSLRLQESTIKWWKSLGSGYTGIMARLLDEARKHPDWIKMCL